MAQNRNRSLSLWLTQEQYDRCELAAGARPVSEWAREALVHALEREAFEAAALRRLDILERMIQYIAQDLSSGVPISTERIRLYRSGAVS